MTTCCDSGPSGVVCTEPLGHVLPGQPHRAVHHGKEYVWGDGGVSVSVPPSRPSVRCASNLQWVRPVVGSKGDEYYVRYGSIPAEGDETVSGYVCSCDGFRYRYRCKHIALVKNQRCRWRGETNGTVCPECGGPLAREG